MKEYYKDCLEATKKNIDFMEDTGLKELPSRTCSEYDFVYYWTNEDINNSLNVAQATFTRSLSVLGSGDHPFNLIGLGAKEIDTFDSNKLTEIYALGFKKAMILKYTYSRFIKNMENIRFGRIGFNDVSDLIKGLFPYMEKDYQLFFQGLIDYAYKKKLPVKNVIDIIAREEHDLWKYQIPGNNYLQNREAYEKLRQSLNGVNITFKALDALKLREEYQDKKYDAILLSNILDYYFRFYHWRGDYRKIFGYEKELETLLNKNGALFLYYIFQLPAPDGWIYPFNDYDIIPEDLKEEELIKFLSCYDCYSGIVLKREGSQARTLKI